MIGTLHFGLAVGWAARRRVRRLMEGWHGEGVKVTWVEDRKLLRSDYVVRVQGDEREVRARYRSLQALAEALTGQPTPEIQTRFLSMGDPEDPYS